MYYVMLYKQNRVLTVFVMASLALLLILLLWAGSYYFRAQANKYRVLMLKGEAVVIAPVSAPLPSSAVALPTKELTRA